MTLHRLIIALLIVDIAVFTNSSFEVVIVIAEIIALIAVTGGYKRLVELLILNVEIYFILISIDTSLEVYMLLVELMVIIYLLKKTILIAKKIIKKTKIQKKLDRVYNFYNLA